MKKLMIFINTIIILNFNVLAKDAKPAAENPFSSYLEHRRELVNSINDHTFKYCTQALFNICKKNSLPVIPESGKIRRQVRLKNHAKLQEYYTYVHSSCVVRLEDACNKTRDKLPVEYVTHKQERRAARQWYVENKKLRKELDACSDSTCRQAVQAKIEANNKEKNEDNLSKYLNKKQRACLEWERIQRQEEAIHNIDAILTQMKFPDAELLTFELPKKDAVNKISNGAEKYYCNKMLVDIEEKSGKKAKKDKDKDKKKKKKKKKKAQVTTESEDETDDDETDTSSTESTSTESTSTDTDTTPIEGSITPGETSITIENNYSYEADVTGEGELVFANPTEEQKAILKDLSLSIATLTSEIKKEKLNTTCSEDIDCGIIQTQVNKCGNYNQSIALNNKVPNYAEFEKKISELNETSKKYNDLKDTITGLNNKQYCPQVVTSLTARCVDNICSK